MYHVLSRQACLFLPSTFSLVHVCSILLLERLPRRRCQVVSPISKLSVKVAVPPSCCRGNFHSFFMKLFTGRGRHRSSSSGGGAWVSVVMLNSFGFNPLGASAFGPPRSSGLLYPSSLHSLSSCVGKRALVVECIRVAQFRWRPFSIAQRVTPNLFVVEAHSFRCNVPR